MTAGLLSGLTAAEVRARYDEIVAFAELEDVHRPCGADLLERHVPAPGLRVAAVHFDPEILVIDEVLAVGDARFQQKCLARITTFRATGQTLVLASHVPEQIKSLCDDVLVLDEGRAVMRAAPVEALRCYDDLMLQRTERRARALGRAWGSAGADRRGASATAPRKVRSKRCACTTWTANPPP